MSKFQVGDKVKIRPGISAMTRGTKKDNILYAEHHRVDPYATHEVVAVHANGVGTTYDLKGAYCGFFEDRLESIEEWGKHQVAFNEKASAAWGAYANSRKVRLSDEGRNIFMAGWSACERAKVDAMFDSTIALARKTDPAASKEAAVKVRMKAGVIRDLIIHHLTVHGGLTGTELAEKIGVPRDSVSPRIPQLRNAGRIEEMGRRNGQTVYVRVL